MIPKIAGVLFLLMATLFSVSACSVFSPVKSESTTSYIINAVPAPASRRAPEQVNVLVTPPEANSIYNTLQMAYSSRRYEIDYFVKSRWADTPPQMLQPLIIETLQNTHYFHSVDSSLPLGHHDYVLNTHLMMLLQDYSRYPYTVHLILRAQLFNANTNTMVGTREFSAIEPIRLGNPYGGVIATNQATARILGQLAQFCMNKISDTHAQQ